MEDLQYPAESLSAMKRARERDFEAEEKRLGCGVSGLLNGNMTSTHTCIQTAVNRKLYMWIYIKHTCGLRCFSFRGSIISIVMTGNWWNGITYTEDSPRSSQVYLFGACNAKIWSKILSYPRFGEPFYTS